MVKLNQAWRFRAQIRAACSFALSIVTFWLYVQNSATGLLLLSIVFSIFTAIPLFLIQRCNPPLSLKQEGFVLRTILQRTIATQDVDHIVYNAEKKLLGLMLTSGKIIAIPWQLIDDPLTACNTFNAHNFHVTDTSKPT
ncbi:MAG: hypothetical protein KTR20_11425 [Cellvibrionaceae bacterium]|nr:hypothetical protein [Cellvibrionaceae bacterium]